MKRKLFLFPILFIFMSLAACGKISDELVDNQFADYRVQKITAPSSFVYSDTDSLITVAVQVSNPSSIQKAWMTIKNEDASQYLVKNQELKDDGNKFRGDAIAGDGIYSETFAMSKKYSNGKYIIEIFVEDNLALGLQSIAKVGEQSMIYNNKQTNYAPVISNLTLPSSLNRGESFVMSVKVDDANGLADIAMVYLQLYRPDGTIVMASATENYFVMFDNGDTAGSGDVATGDGTYSLRNSFAATTVIGTWKFEFRAKDKSGIISNILTKSVEVK